MSNTRLTRWVLRGSLLAAGVAAFAFPALASGAAFNSAQETTWGEPAADAIDGAFLDQFFLPLGDGTALLDDGAAAREETETTWG